jgi:beta-N-acetylhexosaminidase
MQKQKVAATSKHFPGDGTGYTNQHFSITPMNLSYKKWTHQHGRVFQTMIDSGVMCIMAGHISFPDYEKNLTDAGYLPATLSDELMTKLLKNEMGFKGVVVSDALNMAGIHTYYPTQLETEIACFKAGADVLLWPRLEIIDTIEARINRGEIPMERLNDALGRIWRMKKQLGVFEKDYQYVQPISDEQLKKDNETAYEIASKAVTVIENKKQMIPLDTATSKNILVVYISANDLTERFKPMVDQLKSQGFKVDTRHNLSWFLYARMVDSIAVNYQKVIVVFNQTPGNPWGTLGLSGDEALSTWSVNMLPLSQVISIGFGDPYKNFIDMPRIWCRINVYNADQNSQKAVVDVLTGKIKATATSPVTYN